LPQNISTAAFEGTDSDAVLQPAYIVAAPIDDQASVICVCGLADLACEVACEALVGWPVPACCIAPAFDPKLTGRAAAFSGARAQWPSNVTLTTSQTDLHFTTRLPPINGVVASRDTYGFAHDRPSPLMSAHCSSGTRLRPGTLSEVYQTGFAPLHDASPYLAYPCLCHHPLPNDTVQDTEVQRMHVSLDRLKVKRVQPVCSVKSCMSIAPALFEATLAGWVTRR